MKQKVFAPILIILILAAALLGGYFVYQKSTNKPTSSPEPSPLSTEAPAKVEDPTTNWKTYSDERLMFKYPEDWIVDPIYIFGSGSVVEFKYQKTSAFSLTYIANYNNGTKKPFATLEEFIGTRDRYAKEILLAGQKAKYVNDPGDSGHVVPYEEVTIFSPDRSSITSLRYTKANYEKSGADKILEQILSTFKFTN